MNDLDHGHRIATDAAILAVRRAAVRTFMRLGHDFQRAALAQATADPRVIERAMKLILQPGMQDDRCQCGTG